MSTAREHADWLSLVETSGPFLSVPVLTRVYPQGMDPRNAEQAVLLREAYEDWLDRGAKDPAVHRLWILHVLTQLLGYPAELLTEGQTLPPGLEAQQPQYGETIRPDFALKHRDDGNKPCLLIQTYGPDQDLEKPLTGKPWKAAPGTRMMELLHATDIPVGLITNGEQWMLVNARRGESTGFASWYADLWMQEPITLRAFHSLLGLRRLIGVAATDTLPVLLAESSKDQQEVTDQLGTQVRHAVEVLVQAFDSIDADSGRTLLAGVSEKDLYDSALTVMMRLVFLFSAEERGLLLLNDRFYDEHYAVSTLREQLREKADQHGEELLERRYDAWSRLLATFRVVHGGVAHEAMRLPAYGGSLFNPDRYPHLEGRAVGTSWKEAVANPLHINNRVVLHLLEALQLLRIKGESRRISFRALDIEQIGHVYEGLLDHTAKRAAEVVLGLAGKNEPEIALSELEQRSAGDQQAFLKYLKEETGRSESALKKALHQPEVFDVGILLAATGNDRAIVNRLAPFAPLLRQDDFERYMVIMPGSVYVTRGSERRSTGTHYTPRSLTEPVVQYTLEPLVYTGPAEGLPKAEWKLKTAKEILALKVCDMAMGSGAFLVQACRYLSERLVEAWEQLEKAAPGMVVVTPEGELSAGDHTERIVPRDAAERIAVARRYVADRCLYGVDINPMAVEMAKLSLWLITLQKDRPFNFLDHAFKCGDSLLGVSTVKQIENFSLRPGDRQITLGTVNMFRYVEEAAAKRLALEALPSNDFSQIEVKNRLHAEAERAIVKVKAIADCLIGLELLGLGERAYEPARDAAAERVQLLIQQDADARVETTSPSSMLAQAALTHLKGRRAFHWPVEFPEVFNRGGFNAIIGNPPFLGGTKLDNVFGAAYRAMLVKAIARDVTGVRGSADFCTYFVLRAEMLCAPVALAGLIVTNSLGQGDARTVGFEQILARGHKIVRAIPSNPWPGQATVFYAMVCLRIGIWNGIYQLDDAVVDGIDSALSAAGLSNSPRAALYANEGIAFVGINLGGEGFVAPKQWATALLEAHPTYAPVLRPYLTGALVNGSPNLEPDDHIVTFYDWPISRELAPEGWLGPVASEFPECLAWVEKNVKPYRDGLTKPTPWNKKLRTFWWHFGQWRWALETAMESVEQVFVLSRVTPYIIIEVVGKEWVFSDRLTVFVSDSKLNFIALQSCFHQTWAWKYGTTNLSILSYSPSECFLTFPLPSDGTPEMDLAARTVAVNFIEVRRLAAKSRWVGLTEVYNRFHDHSDESEDLVRLRALQVEMDMAVAVAYGWRDLELDHGFHATKQGRRFTISETARQEVLKRLLALNHQRYAEEVAAGLHEKKKSKGKKGKGNSLDESGDAPNLFTE